MTKLKARRLFVVLDCVFAFLLAGYLALWVILPVDRIKREEFIKIRPGMTVEEVEEILGTPTGNDPDNLIIMFEGGPKSFASPDRFPPNKLRQWVGRDHAILVELDEQGRVSDRYFGHTNRPEGFFAKLRRWFRL